MVNAIIRFSSPLIRLPKHISERILQEIPVFAIDTEKQSSTAGAFLVFQQPLTNASMMKDVLAFDIGGPRDLFHHLNRFHANEAFAIVRVGSRGAGRAVVFRVWVDRLRD